MRNLYRLFSCLLLLILTGGMRGFSQSPDSPENLMQPGYYLCEDDLIEIMFIESSRVRLRNDQPTDLISNATSGVDAILSSLQWHTWYRFSDVDEMLIDRWAEAGERNTGQKLYNLNNIFRLQIPKGHDIWEISKNLEALPGIYLARPVPKPMPLPLPGNYQSQQGYLKSASSTPTGIDALWSWTQPGGTGSGTTVCDLEYSWNYNHADITKAIGSQINVNVVDPFSDSNHGTAVIGMLVADNNGWGITGICHGANLKTCGTYYGSPSPVWNVPAAIALAIANLSPGDVILLEHQWDYTGSGGFIPIEWWLNYSPLAQTNNGVYAAIQTAVANGIHVVEAGGNGSFNTQTLTWLGNSGAIIVGAGGAYPGGTYPEGDLQRLSFSSYGPRFDMQGWGENIVTTAYGDLYNAQGANYYYTSTFSGTSSASPVVAGAVACFQGYLNANAIPGFSPSLVRNHLTTWGTPQIFPPAGHIGSRPDLNNAVLNIPPLLDYDWGDAPDPLYPTLAASIGANHQIISGIRLGNLIDAEPDGLPTINADGDDLNNLPDEDGVTFLWPLAAGNPCRIKVNASTNSALFSGWFDFNQNGSWADPQEKVFNDLVLKSGDNYLTFIAPPNTLPGFTYSRFRYSTQPGLSFTGTAPDGEVEDYKIMVEEYGDIKWRQFPEPNLPGLHANPTSWIADDWICYGGLVTDIHWWGNYELDINGFEKRGAGVNHFLIEVFTDAGCLPGAPALGLIVPFNTIAEQFTGMNSADGSPIYKYDFILPAPFMQLAGTTYWLRILAMPNDMANMAVWRWQEANRDQWPINCGAASSSGGPWQTIVWNTPPPVRFSDMAFVITSQEFEIDFGDAPDGPYPTLLVNGGAHHQIVPGMHLGALIDGEPDGQPDPNATGDDLSGLNDEDGVTFLNAFIPSQSVVVQFVVNGTGYINGWFDWDANGTWSDPGEHVIIDQSVNTGIFVFNVVVPNNLVAGLTFARFRFSSIPGIFYTGYAPDGEVEDYEIYIEEGIDNDFGDAPEGALAYPVSGVIGQFPTCMNVGPPNSWIQHSNFGAFFGPSVDLEPEGNAGFCPTFNPNMYNQDECFQDGDAGLTMPGAFTIAGPLGTETVVPCPNSPPAPLGLPCIQAVWGGNIDIMVQNTMPNMSQGFVNVLIDWNQNGIWGGASLCLGSVNAPEHVLVNFIVPNGFNGLLSALGPPAFTIGPNLGYVWARFTITESPVNIPWDGSGIFEDGETEDYLILIGDHIPPDTFEYGDAPEGALAYPASGVIGQFPTCMNVGPPGYFVQHSNSGAFLGPTVDLEPEGNAGFCPTFNSNMYDLDECFADGDAGLILPGAFTIVGPMGAEMVVPCPGSPPIPLGNVCTPAIWGGNIDIIVQNTMPVIASAFVNVLIDWNQDGQWSGFSTCPDGTPVPEHVLVDFQVPHGFTGTLAALAPPPFIIGPNSGYVWARISITEIPVGVGWYGAGVFEDGETEDYLLWVLPDPDKTLQNITIPGGQATCYDAANTITTAGSGTTFIVQNGATVYLVAGNSIHMLPGTHLQNGSYVHAYIDQTGEFCSNPKAIVVEEEPVPETLPNEFAEKDSFFRVFPNPNTGQFTLELKEVKELSTISVEIFSLVGETVMKLELPAMKQYLFDLSEKQPGIYLIRVMQGNDLGVEKVIKQ